jgi:acyl-CoA synthetase (AMP-forming)/AMP-acid ligase II
MDVPKTDPKISEESTAYIIFTSGSTGAKQCKKAVLETGIYPT